MSKQLTVHNATITTATVEVKAIKISGKQVTIAVYQQLRSEPLVAHDGTLNGVPWGYVNRCTSDCTFPPHWHMVWQRGSDLLRSVVFKEAPADAYTSEGMDRYLTAAVREYLRGRPTGFKGNVPLVEAKDQGISADGRLLAPWKFNNAVAYAMDDERTFINTAASPTFKWTGKADPAAVVAMSLSEKHLRLHGFHGHQNDLQASGAEAVARLDALVNGWGSSFSEIKRDVHAELDAEAERRQRHRDLRKTLADLPQLFIAV